MSVKRQLFLFDHRLPFKDYDPLPVTNVTPQRRYVVVLSLMELFVPRRLESVVENRPTNSVRVVLVLLQCYPQQHHQYYTDSVNVMGTN
jgi:hypothetical protein